MALSPIKPASGKEFSLLVRWGDKINVVKPVVLQDFTWSVDRPGQIIGFAIAADVAGVAVFDIRRTPSSRYPPAAEDSICNGLPPQLADQKFTEPQYVQPPTWDTALQPGQWLTIVLTKLDSSIAQLDFTLLCRGE